MLFNCYNQHTLLSFTDLQMLNALAEIYNAEGVQ